MSMRSPAQSVRTLIVLAWIIAGFAIATADAQTPYKAPRTWLGYPDLQANWTNETTTRLSRPLEMG
jgi:hypothetical protein